MLTAELFTVGSLVRARGREWVVLPGSEPPVLTLRPLGGTEDEVVAVHTALEEVRPARFDPPDTTKPGDFRSSRLLRDAVRLGLRSGAGPFRSLGSIAVEPRPYQLVPLMMALKLDPVRLLIADDVGIGKTVEAALVARELLDRGEVRRLCVLCPPHLAEQWQGELDSKFHLEAELVLPSTAARLESRLRYGQSLFERFPVTVVSTDFIKSDRYRHDFLRDAPELVLVDEAHTCVGPGGRGRHQRFDLLRDLARDEERHLVLVTATPHSGNEDAFRSLLGLLSPEFVNLPEDLSAREAERQRERLARHFVQRRRPDLRRYLEAETPFPQREEAELTWRWSPEGRRLLDRLLAYARESIQDTAGGTHRQRVRWWSALALLRAVSSSPAAAAATLRTRAATAGSEDSQQADEIGCRTVLDLVEEGLDVIPGSDPDDPGREAERRRLLDFARDAEKLAGRSDPKVAAAAQQLGTLLDDGFRPIVFCRFIATADYVAEELRRRLGAGVEVASVTGLLPPAEREERVLALAGSPRRVLVCTDCLSEGINLQEHFDAVLHYDLSWNPTRHEQREGRVDRYGQPRERVRVLTLYGADNPVDGVVLEVLLRKHRTIRNALGISVPVPADTQQVVQALLEGLLLRGKPTTGAQQLTLDFAEDEKRELHLEWDRASEREKASRTRFAQWALQPEEVARELAESRRSVGSGADVERFLRAAVPELDGVVSPRGDGSVEVDLAHAPLAVREAVGRDRFRARFELPVRDGELCLLRTHPVVEALAVHMVDTALDPRGEGRARRCGALRTAAVQRRTNLLLLRVRFHLAAGRRGAERLLLAEECLAAAFQGSGEWLAPEAAEALLEALPDGNVHPDQATEFLQEVLADLPRREADLAALARQRAERLAEAHARVRTASRQSGRVTVEPQLPVDVLGVYVLLPVVRR